MSTKQVSHTSAHPKTNTSSKQVVTEVTEEITSPYTNYKINIGGPRHKYFIKEEILDDKGNLLINELELEHLRKNYQEETMEKKVARIINKLFELSTNPRMIHELLQMEIDHKLARMEFDNKYKRKPKG
jgi:lysyl-tRNA synthetase class II